MIDAVAGRRVSSVWGRAHDSSRPPEMAGRPRATYRWHGASAWCWPENHVGVCIACRDGAGRDASHAPARPAAVVVRRSVSGWQLEHRQDVAARIPHGEGPPERRVLGGSGGGDAAPHEFSVGGIGVRDEPPEFGAGRRIGVALAERDGGPARFGALELHEVRRLVLDREAELFGVKARARATSGTCSMTNWSPCIMAVFLSVPCSVPCSAPRSGLFAVGQDRVTPLCQERSGRARFDCCAVAFCPEGVPIGRSRGWARVLYDYPPGAPAGQQGYNARGQGALRAPAPIRHPSSIIDVRRRSAPGGAASALRRRRGRRWRGRSARG